MISTRDKYLRNRVRALHRCEMKLTDMLRKEIYTIEILTLGYPLLELPVGVKRELASGRWIDPIGQADKIGIQKIEINRQQMKKAYDRLEIYFDSWKKTVKELDTFLESNPELRDYVVHKK